MNEQTDPGAVFRLREPRRTIAFPVLVEWRDGIRRHIARNISDSGILLEADPPYPMGATVRVIFTYPDSRIELTAIGEVRHVGERPVPCLGGMITVTGIGIEFQRFEDGIVKPESELLAS
jgi:hypothetical protein